MNNFTKIAGVALLTSIVGGAIYAASNVQTYEEAAVCWSVLQANPDIETVVISVEGQTKPVLTCSEDSDGQTGAVELVLGDVVELKTLFASAQTPEVYAALEGREWGHEAP